MCLLMFVAVVAGIYAPMVAQSTQLGDIKLVSPYYCHQTNTVLRRTPLLTYLNFADATTLCSINHGHMATFVAYKAGCVSAALEERMIAWLNKDGDPGVALVADTSPITSTREKKQVLYAMCETNCTRQLGDHIVDVSSNGNVTCDIGYEYLDNQPVCNGTTTIEMCTAVNCTVPVILSGTANASVIHFGQKVRYACTSGLLLIGDATPACTPRRTLTSVPFCQNGDCAVHPVTNGKSSVIGGILEGQKVNFTCDRGFSLVGKAESTCAADGTITAPTCLDVDECSHTITPVCGTKIKCRNTIGSYVCYCDPGYIVENHDCVPDNCSVPVVANAATVVSVIKHLESVTYTCNSGYWMLGQATTTCNVSITALPECYQDTGLTGYQYCSITDSILRRTAVGTRYNYTTSHAYCKLKNGRLLTAAAYTGNCVGNLATSQLISWVDELEPNDRNVAYVTDGTRTLDTLVYAICEFDCNRQASDQIWNISADGIVQCNNGYEYLGNQPVCYGSTQASTCTPVKCTVPNIPDGLKSAAQISFQETVTYSCKVNYVLDGDAKPTCQADRSLTTPTCKRWVFQAGYSVLGIEWAHVLAFVSVAVHDDFASFYCNRTASDHIWNISADGMVQCNSGYEYLGNQPVCNGSNQAPTCTPVKCTVPNIPDGQKNAAQISFQETVTYSCKVNYVLDGDANPTCQADRSLTTPTCKKDTGLTGYRYCSTTNSILKRTALGTHFKFKTSQAYCKLKNGRLLTANSFNGMCVGILSSSKLIAWVDALPQPNFALATNGNRHILREAYAICEFDCNRTASDHIWNISADGMVQCNSGYEYLGNQPVCNGSNQAPTCTPVKCTVPNIRDGLKNAAQISFQETVTYSCKVNYVLDGDANPTCQADRSLTTPTCKEDTGLTGYRYCSTTNSILKRTALGTHFKFKTSQAYCKLKNGRLLTANSFNGMCVGILSSSKLIAWVDALPQPNFALATNGNRHILREAYAICEFDCNRTASDHIWKISASGMVQCNNGYEYLGNQSVCNGSNQAPTCTPVNCTVPGILNGTVNASVIHFGQKVRYACTSGLLLIGDAMPACTPSRTLTSVPFCQNGDCAVHPVTNGKSSVIGGILEGQKVNFTCNRGFSLVGKAESTCAADGTITAPTCLDVDECSKTITPVCGPTVKCRNTIGSYVCYCDPGYIVENNDCVPHNCSVPVVANAGTVVSVIKHLESVTYTCNSGYWMLGQATTTCNVSITALPECYQDTGLTGYQYCSITNSILRRTAVDTVYNYTTSHAYCQLKNGRLLTAAAYNGNCVGTLATSLLISWVDELEPNNPSVAYVTGGTRSLDQDVYAICEFDCNRTASDHIWNISASGMVQCNNGYEYLGNQPVCNGSNQAPTCTRKLFV
ncbi:sushi, von Willebrand factor type A, EGF and pentraxin domain-containing protein 1-like [Sycon ciliatum]|uniref:sushi, von Willebrand factor type A, EGF and pentraxin domain-containing protein 1-like n=1 Tax=Sycon ciliatum TaxID=27933 RepID=UPI0031F5F4BD